MRVSAANRRGIPSFILMVLGRQFECQVGFTEYEIITSQFYWPTLYFNQSLTK